MDCNKRLQIFDPKTQYYTYLENGNVPEWKFSFTNKIPVETASTVAFRRQAGYCGGTFFMLLGKAIIMNKNPGREEGLTKLTEMVESIGICMFLTKNNDASHIRPMATINVDENGDIWFFTRRSSLKVGEIQGNDEVRLLYSHPGKDSYLDITGTGYLETSREKMQELWSPLVKAWFPEGLDDPELTLLRVEVDSAYYWDSGTSKMISFFKMITAAVIGKQVTEGEEGQLIPKI